LLALAQALLVSLLFWGIYLIVDFVFQKGLSDFLGDYFLYWLIILTGLAMEMFSRDTNMLVAPLHDRSLVRQFPVATRQVVFALGGLLLVLVFKKDQAISRLFLLLFPACLYAVILWSNAVLPQFLARALFRGYRQFATLLVGSPEHANALEGWLRMKEQFGLKIVGLLTVENETGQRVDCFTPELGGLDQFESTLEGDVQQVILVTTLQQEQMRQIVKECEKRGIRLVIMNNFAEMINHPIVCRTDEGINLITLFEEPLENPFNRVLKRVVDLTISWLIVLLILPWLCILFWLIHRSQSPGPLFHKQPRSGLQNNPFEIIKFRTMHVDSDDINRQATEGDERIFPAGRWLRRFSLDEFPQFLNVLRGEMSVVGPRPHLIDHNRQFADLLEQYHQRAFIKPGITGLAQVRGFRGEATREAISARLQSDLLYGESWSLSLDLSIILRTIWQMIVPPRSAV